jgi:hypothetical protein
MSLLIREFSEAVIPLTVMIPLEYASSPEPWFSLNLQSMIVIGLAEWSPRYS